MDPTQEQHERAVGDGFITWYNTQHGTEFRYGNRSADPPDLIYRAATEELLLEIAGAYYHEANATMLWQRARHVPGAPDTWSSKNPDQKLIDSISAVLANEATKQYSENCVLVVNVYPDITSPEELATLLGQISVPSNHPFKEIYVTGTFPVSSSGSSGGYHCWKLA